MTRTAKLFLNGRSQAVRLPADFRFEGQEVLVRRDPDTGDVILSPKSNGWDDFIKLVKRSNLPQDFMNDRSKELAQDRDLF